MYGIEDFNLEDFELVGIAEIVDEGKQLETYDIEVEDKHYFLVRNPHNKINENIISHNTAEIAFGDYNDEIYLDLKNYTKNPHRKEYGWTSNNSIFAELGMDYSNAAQRTKENGEPGYVWLDNMRGYSRIKNGMDNKDKRVVGANPCIVGDTLIAVADGRNAVKVKDLVKTKYPVYSIENGKVVIKETIRTWKTKENAEIWKLTLDGGSFLLATPDHKVMLRNGTYKELKDLLPEESLMPFNSYISNKRYRQIVSNTGGDRKVKSVEFYGCEDVYDITVKDTHNFGIITKKHDDNAIESTGLFVHNCVEQSLESYELCCLVETFPNNHENIDDFKRTLKFAYLYAKTVTLGKTHWSETNRVMLRNRRIGCSVSGIAQFLTKHGIHKLRTWLEEGYDVIQYWDKIYSDWFAVPRSIKTTSVKPSGTVSLLAGATPGIHYPESRYYIRRIRLSKRSKLLKPLQDSGYTIESAYGDTSTVIIEFPIDTGKNIRTVYDVSMWEQLSLASFMQRYWADNQVSATITFDRVREGDQIKYALNFFQYELKGVSFLPIDNKTYPQMPYETISEEKYNDVAGKLNPIDFSSVTRNLAVVDRFCDGELCELGK